MRILTLDLGTRTGWAVGERGRLQSSGVYELKSSRYDGGGMRYLRFRTWLSEMLAMLGTVDALYFEEVRRHKSTDAAHVHGGLLAHLTAWCEEQQPKVPYQGVPVGTIKKHATTKGNAGKEEVIAAMRTRWWPHLMAHHQALELTDDNQADALAILSWALEQHPQEQSRKRVRLTC